MNVWLILTMDYFLWLLGSFVASHDIVSDWYAMLRGVIIEQWFFYERWLSFLFGGLVAVNFMVNIIVCYSWIGSFNVRSLNNCKCVARWILCLIDCWENFFGCFKGNFENTGWMEMFSLPGESDLVEPIKFGQGRIQISSLAHLFDSVIWSEWFEMVIELSGVQFGLKSYAWFQNRTSEQR